MYKKRGKKIESIVVAFLVNSLILSVAAIVLYKIDTQTFHKQTGGMFGSLGIVVLIFFIPIITYFNYLILLIKEAFLPKM